jgi:hypothetical protein
MEGLDVGLMLGLNSPDSILGEISKRFSSYVNFTSKPHIPRNNPSECTSNDTMQ